MTSLTPGPSPTPWARGDSPSPSPVKRERGRLAPASQGEGKAPHPSAAVRQAALTPGPSPTPRARGDGPSPSPVKRERDRLAPASQGEGKTPRPSAAVRQAARQMRKESTSSEHLLWGALRDRRLDGHKFRRQHPVGAFILDFYCAEAGLAVEVDGGVHATTAAADAERQQWLEAQGIRFLRLTARLVEGNLSLALCAIRMALTPGPSPTSWARGEAASPSPVKRERDRLAPASQGEG